jgi:hypothetical protein
MAQPARPAMRGTITVLVAGLIVAAVLLPFVTWGWH